MTATMKSRVLVREEKGMGGLSMKRLIFCGMGAGMVYFVLNLSPLQALSIPALFAVFVMLIYLSGQRYGVARWAYLLLTWRGRLLLDTYKNPGGLATQIGSAFNIEAHAAVIDSADLFKGGISTAVSDLRGIEILDSDALDAGGYEVLADDDIVLEAL